MTRRDQARRVQCDANPCLREVDSERDVPRGWIKILGAKSGFFHGEFLVCTQCKLRTRHELAEGGLNLQGGDAWEVRRAPRTSAKYRLLYRGSEGEARVRFRRLGDSLRRGVVRLFAPDGSLVDEHWSF